jgi:DNA mismatch endonuclease, patch repair protein
MMRERSPEVISYTMSRIRSKDTSIEIRLRHALWSKGLRYRKHYKVAVGCPDIAFPRAKVAIFCDSTFWHGRDWEQRKPKLKSNREYWISKIERNMTRDVKVTLQLQEEGWQVLRFWDVEIERNLDVCVEAIMAAVSRGRISRR